MVTDDVLAWAVRDPARTALTWNGRRLSYRGMANAILVARAHLRGAGLTGPGVVVVAFYSLVDFWVLSLALRSLGLTTYAVQSAQGTTLPSQRTVRAVVKRPDAEFRGLDEVCRQSGIRLLSIPYHGDRDAGDPVPHPQGGHILRTSGTTGTSKNILMDPGFEDRFHAKRREVLGLNGHTAFHLFDLPPWTGAGYKTAAAVWAVGGAIILSQQTPLHAAFEVAGTHAVLVPDKLGTLLEAPEDAFAPQAEMQLSIAGGTATSAQIEAARRRVSPLLFNRISSTEVSIFGFTRMAAPDDRRWHRPVERRLVEVVDDDGDAVPVGTEGRLRVSTEGGPQTYLGNPAASREFFRDGFFYPGDLAVFRPDGRFALRGRITDVINVAGQKFSAGPIEDALRERLGVTALCLFSMQDGVGEEQLHLVIEGCEEDRAAHTSSAEKLIRGATARISYSERLPRTETGKIIRRKVRDEVSVRETG